MTRAEVKTMVSGMDIPFDEVHPDHITASRFANLEPPFLEYVLTDAPVFADGRRYLDIKRLTITLWSDTEECEAEESVETVLSDHDLRWRVNREYVEEPQLWAITFNLEV